MAIYDCMGFFNEVDLIKLRLEVLSPYVDHFVIVESKKTYRGDDKPLVFQEHIDEFAEYMDKIIYITSDDDTEWNGDGDWTVETHQRNLMVRGLEQCDLDDIVIISDVDEIPNPDILVNMDKYYVGAKYYANSKRSIRRLCYGAAYLSTKELIDYYREKLTLAQAIDKMHVTMCLKNHYYFMNCQAEEGIHCNIITKYKNLYLPQVARNNRPHLAVLKDAGWHFSYLGGLEKIKAKAKSIIDERPEIIDKMKQFESADEYIIDCIEKGIDIYGRDDATNKFAFIDKDKIGFPNIDYYIEKFPDFFYFKESK